MSAGDFVYHTGFADNLGLNLPLIIFITRLSIYETTSRRKGSLEDQEPSYTEQEIQRNMKRMRTCWVIPRDQLPRMKNHPFGCHFNVVLRRE